MIFYCQHCRYTFTADDQPAQCPDCGKPDLRPATAQESADYERTLREVRAESWDDCKQGRSA